MNNVARLITNPKTGVARWARIVNATTVEIDETIVYDTYGQDFEALMNCFRNAFCHYQFPIVFVRNEEGVNN